MITKKNQWKLQKKLETSFSELYNMKKMHDIQLLDNNEKDTFMSSFPQVDPRYGKVLALNQVPHEEWHEHQKWARYYLHFCNKYGSLVIPVVYNLLKNYTNVAYPSRSR